MQYRYQSNLYVLFRIYRVSKPPTYPIRIPSIHPSQYLLPIPHSPPSPPPPPTSITEKARRRILLRRQLKSASPT